MTRRNNNLPPPPSRDSSISVRPPQTISLTDSHIFSQYFLSVGDSRYSLFAVPMFPFSMEFLVLRPVNLLLFALNRIACIRGPNRQLELGKLPLYYFGPLSFIAMRYLSN